MANHGHRSTGIRAMVVLWMSTPAASDTVGYSTGLWGNVTMNPAGFNAIFYASNGIIRRDCDQCKIGCVGWKPLAHGPAVPPAPSPFTPLAFRDCFNPSLPPSRPQHSSPSLARVCLSYLCVSVHQVQYMYLCVSVSLDCVCS